jgi:hypothetical protein
VAAPIAAPNHQRRTTLKHDQSGRSPPTRHGGPCTKGSRNKGGRQPHNNARPNAPHDHSHAQRSYRWAWSARNLGPLARVWMVREGSGCGGVFWCRVVTIEEEALCVGRL